MARGWVGCRRTPADGARDSYYTLCGPVVKCVPAARRPVGETIEHDKRRTVSEADNQQFCDMTMNQQPLHLDADFAADSQFGQRLVNGLYTMSLAVGLTIPDTTDGTIVANLSYDDVEHPNPVFHGDTIYAQTTVTDKRETSDGDRGVVTMRVEAFKVEPDGEDDTLVCELERTALSLKNSE
ncbi:molybdenum cofactor biosynthesis protein [Halobacteriales archaeon QH_7_69_31]|nr:MAG: molybdenum cofactor biosynthesis protein [Halobacteriales archaeon QH_7_69_31]